MSPSKSKAKSSARAAKEQNASSKPAVTAGNSGNGIPTSAYNPVSGTFHTLETAPMSSSPPVNGRFRNIDETDVHSGSSFGMGMEYDSVSNNDSCSGESEDQKEKVASVTPRLEAIPGCDNDKREKNRQKNERKHQRQRERRAQELHDRCSGYIMARKLEALAQPLLAMGFSSERATMALILNEGRAEESVTWLLEGGEEGADQKNTSLHTGGNLKIDITEELRQITEMEVRYKCTKQEVERVVVSCEGDLDKAAETLRLQKQELVATLPKLEGTGDPPAIDGGKRVVTDAQSPMRTLVKSVTSMTIESRKDERDFNYTKAVSSVVPSESGTKNLQPLRKIPPKSEWAKTPAASIPVDKRWPGVSTSPSVSYSLASSLHVSPPPAKGETQYVVLGSESKNLSPVGSVREPVIMMQHPQTTANTKQNSATSLSSTPTSARWHPSSVAGVEAIKMNAGVGHILSANLSSSNLDSHDFPCPQQYQHFISSSVEPTAAGWGSSWSLSGTNLSASLSVPSSLGLFTGWGSTGTSGSSSPVDWSTGGSMTQCDYNNIDWSLEATSSRQSDLWMGLTSCVKTSRIYDGWSKSTAATNGSVMGVNGVCIGGMTEGVVPDASSSAGPHEWTSPFAGKDLFTLPRQFVTSPSQ